MNRSIRIASILSLVAAAAGAQNPPPPGGAPAPGPRRETAGPPAAEMLLSRAGELELTDQQVVRLAGIARRSAARRRALTAAFDSGRTRFTQPADSVARRQFRQRMDGEMGRAEEQMRVDQRDAIAVLTPDQQAKAWNMVASRGGPGRGREMGGRGMAGRGMAGRGRVGMRPERGPRPGRPMAEPGMRREPGFGPERLQRRRGDEFAPPMRRAPVRRPDAQGVGSGE